MDHSPGSTASAADRAEPSAASGPSTASIRKFRARKLRQVDPLYRWASGADRCRPCDICRSRRKRCIIARAGSPCTICIHLGKECTFLYDRDTARSRNRVNRLDSSDEAAAMLRPAPFDDRDHDQRHDDPPIAGLSESPAWSHPAIYPDATPYTAAEPTSHSSQRVPAAGAYDAVTTYAPPDPPADWMSSFLELLGQPRQTRSTLPNTVAPLPYDTLSATPSAPVALDDEAGDEYELYLVGTASERDALNLNSLTSDQEVTSPFGTNDPPGSQMRRVSPTTCFVRYTTRPYGPEDEVDDAQQALEALIGRDNISLVLAKFRAIEGAALPIFSERPSSDMHPILQSLAVTAGLIYHRSLQHLNSRAYTITMRAFRRQPLRTRLWTVQLLLLDMNGRRARDPSHNFIALAQAVSVSRMMALHEDPSAWSIPQWEKELRIRMWWALYTHDKLSALLFGRPSTIAGASTVRLPLGTPSYRLDSHDAFVLLCKLVQELENYITYSSSVNQDGTSYSHDEDQLLLASTKLDRWKREANLKGLFEPPAFGCGHIPGVLSVRLTYHGMRLLVGRDSWDAMLKSAKGQDAGMLSEVQMTCLSHATQIVDMVSQLSSEEKGGYWSSHSPFVLSSCLTVLLRLIMTWHLAANNQNYLWRQACDTLRRFVSVLQVDQWGAEWDVATLVLSRARHFVPLLACRVPELSGLFIADAEAEDANERFINALLASMTGSENLAPS